jgi:hypothetical protein
MRSTISRAQGTWLPLKVRRSVESIANPFVRMWRRIMEPRRFCPTGTGERLPMGRPACTRARARFRVAPLPTMGARRRKMGRARTAAEIPRNSEAKRARIIRVRSNRTAADGRSREWPQYDRSRGGPRQGCGRHFARAADSPPCGLSRRAERTAGQ